MWQFLMDLAVSRAMVQHGELPTLAICWDDVVNHFSMWQCGVVNQSFRKKNWQSRSVGQPDAFVHGFNILNILSRAAIYDKNLIYQSRLPNHLFLCKQLGFVQSIPDVSAPYPHHGLWPLPTISVYHPRSGGFIVALKLLLLLFSRVLLLNEK